MPHNVAVVKTAIVGVVGSTGNIVLSAASAVDLPSGALTVKIL